MPRTLADEMPRRTMSRAGSEYAGCELSDILFFQSKSNSRCSGPCWARSRVRRSDESGPNSFPGDHDLEVFAGYDHGGIARLVHAHDQCVEVVVEVLLRGWVECREGL